MKDFVKFKNIQPTYAEGKVCIDLTDPLTSKVKERIQGDNHVFTDSLFSGYSYDWINTLQYVYLCMNNTDVPFNTKIPYLFGQTVGYGIPTTNGLGLYRGAYNLANQVIRKTTLDSVRWKYQYDFTTAQANGVPINVVGLTSQYSSSSYNSSKQYLKGVTVPTNTSFVGATNDGRYCYSCSAGIVTIYDTYLGTTDDIDLTLIIGTTGNQTVGYALDTGHCYIYVYQSSASLRKMYEFDDSSFSVLLNTYPVSSLAISYIYPMYIYNSTAYFFATSSSIHYADFIDNTAYSTNTISTSHNAMYAEIGVDATRSNFARGSCVLGNKYVFCSSASTDYERGIIFDLSRNEAVAYVYPPYQNTTTTCCHHPITAETIICPTGWLRHNAAITAYKLATPITKTSTNGLTVTYELEVFW